MGYVVSGVVQGCISAPERQIYLGGRSRAGATGWLGSASSEALKAASTRCPKSRELLHQEPFCNASCTLPDWPEWLCSSSTGIGLTTVVFHFTDSRVGITATDSIRPHNSNTAPNNTGERSAWCSLSDMWRIYAGHPWKFAANGFFNGRPPGDQPMKKPYTQ